MFGPLALIKLSAADRARRRRSRVASRGRGGCRGRSCRAAVGVGALDMVGNGLFLLAAQAGDLAVAAILSSLYPVTTVILAAVLLDERITRSHVVGIVAAIAAIVLIGVGRRLGAQSRGDLGRPSDLRRRPSAGRATRVEALGRRASASAVVEAVEVPLDDCRVDDPLLARGVPCQARRRAAGRRRSRRPGRRRSRARAMSARRADARRSWRRRRPSARPRAAS